MNLIKKNIIHILFFVMGVVLISYAFKLHAFGTDYETQSIRSVTLVDTASTFTKVKQITYYNTTGYFVDVLTDNKFHAPIQDKLYREFEAGGSKPISMENNLSQADINRSARGVLALMSSFLCFIVGALFVICVAYSKFKEYKLKVQYFLKYGNQNE